MVPGWDEEEVARVVDNVRDAMTTAAKRYHDLLQAASLTSQRVLEQLPAAASSPQSTMHPIAVGRYALRWPNLSSHLHASGAEPSTLTIRRGFGSELRVKLEAGPFEGFGILQANALGLDTSLASERQWSLEWEALAVDAPASEPAVQTHASLPHAQNAAPPTPGSQDGPYAAPAHVQLWYLNLGLSVAGNPQWHEARADLQCGLGSLCFATPQLSSFHADCSFSRFGMQRLEGWKIESQ